jgi:hypothetical protein
MADQAEGKTLTKRLSAMMTPTRSDPARPKRKSFIDIALRLPEAADDEGTFPAPGGGLAAPLLSGKELPAQKRVSEFRDEGVLAQTAESVQAAPDNATQMTKAQAEATPLPSDGKGGHATRHVPVPKIPDPMPNDLKFMFRKYSNDEVAFVWRCYLVSFIFQVAWCWLYAFALSHPEYISFKAASWIYGVAQAYMCIQNIYLLHDVLHVAPFPPQPWMEYITHPFADLLNCGWQDIMLEHKRHHVATADVLHHGEFGWDPSEVQYFFQEYSKWTAPLCYFVQISGFYDTGMLFMAVWYWNFPNEDAIEPVLKPRGSEDRKKVMQRRIKVAFIQLCMWFVLIKVAAALAYGMHDCGQDRMWPIFLVVLCANKIGWGTAWYFFANINHSETWNEMLADGLDRQNPILDAILCVLLGGRARANEMKFHDLHHAFPNRVGSMSMRGRFYDWDKVHDGALALIANGIFEEPEINAPMVEQEKAASPKEGSKWSLIKKAVTEEHQFKRKSDKLNKLQAKRASNHPAVLERVAKMALDAKA